MRLVISSGQAECMGEPSLFTYTVDRLSKREYPATRVISDGTRKGKTEPIGGRSVETLRFTSICLVFFQSTCANNFPSFFFFSFVYDANDSFFLRIFRSTIWSWGKESSLLRFAKVVWNKLGLRFFNEISSRRSLEKEILRSSVRWKFKVFRKILFY